MDARAQSTSPQRGRRRLRSGKAFPVLILLVFCAGQAALRLSRSWADAPSSAERIYATLVEWGVDDSGLVPPADQTEIDRRVQQLWSDDGEVRVRAAHWLAARGLRDAGDQIAASMADPGTQRPCQRAHSLGKLGDDQWVDELLIAAKQPDNTDLRTCATIALTDIASSRAVDALIELTREDPSRTFGVRALGEAGDQRALDHLLWLRGQATSSGQRRAIETVIGRVEVLSQPDPASELLRRVEASAADQRIDEWALRHLARRADPRCVERLSRVFVKQHQGRRTRELLAAALLAHGSEGRHALARAARLTMPDVREIASIALSLRSQDGSARLALTSDHGAKPDPSTP